MTNPDLGLMYDAKTFVLSNGSIADKLRLASSGVQLPKEELEQAIAALESILNEDGGVPFNMTRGNPSSVKETAEILTLLTEFKKPPSSLVEKMVQFLVSRQKSDGGFAETLNLEPFIEDRYGKKDEVEWYPVGKSITWLTGKAAEALARAGLKNDERVTRARDYLLHTQHEDGHWPDYKGAPESDPLGTGNILAGLVAVGVNSNHGVYVSARAALFQHLKNSIEKRSTYDMVDLASVGRPNTKSEEEVIKQGLSLVLGTQNSDGGWSDLGSKKSNPELTSLLVYAVSKCSRK
ncbi:MAG: terpene cyclase/mutase family protein [Candidatus Thorarchaeota archaeon]|nr:terpene cyclase/mutase family protein [Candidatus Thorarchaeota archaeon]